MVVVVGMAAVICHLFRLYSTIAMFMCVLCDVFLILTRMNTDLADNLFSICLTASSVKLHFRLHLSSVCVRTPKSPPSPPETHSASDFFKSKCAIFFLLIFCLKSGITPHHFLHSSHSKAIFRINSFNFFFSLFQRTSLVSMATHIDSL